MMNTSLLSTRQTIKVKQVLLEMSTWLQESVTRRVRMWFAAILVLSMAVYSVEILDMNPWSWVMLSSGVQMACFTMRGWSAMDVWEKRIFLWSVVSVLSFIHFLLMDPTFVGWTSVYHFCSGPSSGVRIPGTEGGGESFVYCTLNFRWNMAGWRKAISLWNFMLSGALGVQRLCIELGFGGLLPGEEAIPRECFVSIIWRLIPFWLNKWESNFGAECSSILFELPHFAVELLVILPSVQIMAGRMRVLAHAPSQVVGMAGSMVPDVMRCRWIVDRSQISFWERLRKNTRALVLVAGITCAAACNALYMPLYLEDRAMFSPKSLSFAEYKDVLSGTTDASWTKDSLGKHFDDSMIRISQNTSTYTCAVSNVTDCKTDVQKEMVSWMLQHKALTLLTEQGTEEDAAHAPVCLLNLTMSTSSPLWILNMLEREDDVAQNSTHVEEFKHVAFGEYFYGTDVDTSTSFVGMQKLYMESAMRNKRVHAKGNSLMHFFMGRPPKDASNFHSVARKHAIEYDRMTSEEHKRLVPLVEMALAIMRLSCERWFSLMAVFTSFIIFRDPPEYVQQYIRILATMCRVFQQTIIMSFPAVCWGYGAGFLFSMFASVVFWAGPILRMVERIKKVATEVRPLHWHPVTEEEVDRMGGSCAICWGDIAVSDDVLVIEDSIEGMMHDGNKAMGLVCGHAYHTKCILEWLHSCFGQSRRATCPMCQAQVPLQVKYKFTSPFARMPREETDDDGTVLQAPRHAAIPGLAAIAGQMPEEFTGRFDMPLAVQHGMNNNPAVWRQPPPPPDPQDRIVHEDSSSSSSDNGSDDDGSRPQEDIVRAMMDHMQNLRTYRDQLINAPDSQSNSFADLHRTHSAHALIIEESDSDNSGSSIHLPGTSMAHHPSCSTEDSDTAGSDSDHDGSSPSARRRGPFRGMYSRLRPRKWTRS